MSGYGNFESTLDPGDAKRYAKMFVPRDTRKATDDISTGALKAELKRRKKAEKE